MLTAAPNLNLGLDLGISCHRNINHGVGMVTTITCFRYYSGQVAFCRTFSLNEE